MLVIFSFLIGFLSAFCIRLNRKDKVIFVENQQGSELMKNV